MANSKESAPKPRPATLKGSTAIKSKHSFDLIETMSGHLTLTVDNTVIYDGDSWTDAVAATRQNVLATAYQETGDEDLNPNPMADLFSDIFDLDQDAEGVA
jgi:hypothetical protein